MVVKEPVDVSDWARDDEFPFYPVGSREKELLVCPESPNDARLIPGHRYLFKRSFYRYEDQFWAEIIAYQIGTLIGVSVPPAYPAFNKTTGTCAALIEWFTGYPGQKPERFVQGGDLLQGLIDNFDREKGRQHNFEHVQKIFRALSTKGFLKEDWLKWWAGAFTFDALIGNTDRHQDNWGFLVEFEKENQQEFKLAPLFDNGTSLGHEILLKKIDNFYGSKLQRYIEQGTHHMKWKIHEEKRTSHSEFLKKFVESFPGYKGYSFQKLDFKISTIQTILESFSGIDLPVPLNNKRSEFILRLIAKRKEHINQRLEE